jgi:hypothetical protein
VVLTSCEHIIALEPLKNGLMGTLLRYPYEVRSEDEYFDDIQDVKLTKTNEAANWGDTTVFPELGSRRVRMARIRGS